MESIDLTETNNTNELNIIFLNNDREIGRLLFKDNKMIFKGNADKSAKAFFDYLKDYFDKYVK